MTTEEFFKFKDKAERYAEWLYGKRQLSLSQGFDDANDVVTDIFLSKEPDLWRKALPIERDILIMHRIRSRIKDAAHKHWTKQELVFTVGLSIDTAPTGDYTEDGDEENIESGLINDDGRGAYCIRSFENPGPLPGFWYLVRDEVNKLRGLDSKVARAVIREWSITKALKKTRLYTRLFYAILKKTSPTFHPMFTGSR